jgi:hypothetical protein
MIITSRTPTDVALAKIAANQRSREMSFFAAVESLILRHTRRGLDKERIARALGITARGLSRALEPVAQPEE